MNQQQILDFVQNGPSSINLTRNFELTTIRMILLNLIDSMENSFQYKLNNGQILIFHTFYNEFSNRSDEFIDNFSSQVEEILSNIYKNFVNVRSSFKKTKDCYENKIEEVKKGLTSCGCVTDILWEELHTRIWSQVSLTTRQIYAFHKWLESMLILSKIQSKAFNIVPLLKDAIKAIDYGLIMGPDLKDQLLAKSGVLLQKVLIILLDKLNYDFHQECSDWKSLVKKTENHKSITKTHPPINPENQIQIVDYDLNLFDFEYNFFRKKVPFISVGGIAHWPNMSTRKWTLSYLLKSMAFRYVPIEIGLKYTDQNWSQQIMSIDEFINRYFFDRSGMAYMAQYNLFDQMIQLNNDITVPDYCAISENIDKMDSIIDFQINGWFGPAGTVSPLHFDDKHNFLAQIMGTKYIRLYSDITPTEQIYPNQQGSLLWNTSEVDVEYVDKKRFPQFDKIDSKLIFEGILNEGDILYIPKRFWHFIKATSDSFSVNFWWN